MRPSHVAAFALTVFIGSVSCFSIIEKSQEQGCVELQCPTSAFDYGVKSIVNDVTSSSERCSTCKQCTDNGYSICLRVRNSRATRQSASYPGGCSCAHSVPANCHNQLSQTQHPANISMRLYTVCYVDSVQAPPKPLAVNDKASVIVTLESFWQEPYWKEFQPDNITLHYEFVVKARFSEESRRNLSFQAPEHCEQEVKSNSKGEHLCVSQVAVSQNGDGDKEAKEKNEKNAEYDHSDNYDQYDDDLAPEVQFDRDVFAGAKNLKTYYTMHIRRPRQLVIGQRSGDPFRDVDTTIQSEKLDFDLKPETFDMANYDGKASQEKKPSPSATAVKPTGTDKAGEDDEDPEENPMPNAEEEGTEGESEEHGEGTDFFSEGSKKTVSKTQAGEDEKSQEKDEDEGVEVKLSDVKPVKVGGKKKGSKEKIVEPPPSDDEKEEKDADTDKDTESEEQQEKDEAEEEKKIAEDENAEKETDEETKKEDGEVKSGEKDETKDGEEKESDKEEGSEETTTEAEKEEETTDEPKESESEETEDGESTTETPEETTSMDDEAEKAESEEWNDGEDGETEGSASGEEGVEDDEEKLSFYERLMKDKYHLAQVIFGITMGLCLLLILCTLLYRKRCCCKKSKTKTSNGYHYANANQGTELVPLASNLEKTEDHVILEEETKKLREIISYAEPLNPDKLDIGMHIGSGEFGNLHQGLFNAFNGAIHDVNVYVIKDIWKHDAEQLIAIGNLLKLNVSAGVHPNIMSLRAVSAVDDLLLMWESMEHPTLQCVLRESRCARFNETYKAASFLSSSRLITLMIEICIGVEHLFSKGVLHPHLAACNVLIAERGHVKISAFGLADHHCLSQSTTCPSRLRWLSPEHFKKDATVDRQSILWSLGVLIWEVVSLGGTPYSNIRTATGIVDGLRDGSLTLDNVNYCSQAMMNLIYSCANHSQDSRPDVASTRRRLQCFLADSQQHINLEYHESFQYLPIVPQLEFQQIPQ
ncbi:hypothetical protein WR25_02962 [Diploscapter pachys]|uniref:Protein kinase domain-containing protein n=1 Tax=Diploscapter pachys TaxID=2018661 RepID=A0A2A2K3Q6_9BILA|nr:hypothetical protein WR25_02962 [Diploscapter pachys]